MNESMSSWKEQWAELERLLKKAGFTERWLEGAKKPPRFEVDPPATEQEIQQVETQLGVPIPPSLRQVLLQVSAHVHIEWALPEDGPRPEGMEEIFAGECRWDLRALPELQRTHKSWIEETFTGAATPDWPDKDSDPEAIEYELVWHNKFAFLEVGNGDMLGIDTSPESQGAVVYLSHEGGECHGFRLGQSFEDYVDRLTALAFVGAEDSQQEAFLPDAVQGLDIEGDAASTWRDWIDEAANNA